MEKKQESKFLDRIHELNSTVNKGNMLRPPMDSDEAIDFLRVYLLDEDWVGIINPISKDDINTEVAHDILLKYSRKYRKKYKRWRKKKEIELMVIELDQLDMRYFENMITVPISNDKTIDILRSYLLGNDWYTVDPLSKEQTNTEIVYDILRKYSKKFRKELRERSKAWKKRK